MSEFDLIIQDNVDFVSEHSRFTFDYRANSFFLFPNIKSLVCYKIENFNSQDQFYESSLPCKKTVCKIHNESAKSLNFTHFDFNQQSHALVFADHDFIYVEKLFMNSLSEAKEAVFQKLGEELGPRKVRKMKFSPVNGNLLAVLYESNLFEIYDLENDLEEPFLYKNFSSSVKKYSHLVDFCFERPRSKHVQSLDDLRIYFVSEEFELYSLWPQFWPGAFANESFFQRLEYLKSELNFEDFVLAERLEKIKEAATSLNDCQAESQLLILSNYTDQIQQKFEFLEELQLCENEKGVLLFEILCAESLGKILIVALGNNSSVSIYFFVCVLDLNEFPRKKQQFFIELQKLKIENDQGTPLNVRFDNRGLFVFKQTKLLHIDLNFIEELSYKQSAAAFRLAFAEKVGKSISHVVQPEKHRFIDFKSFGDSLIFILAQDEETKSICIISHSLKDSEKKELASQKQNFGSESKLDLILSNLKNFKFDAKEKQKLDQLEGLAEKIKLFAFGSETIKELAKRLENENLEERQNAFNDLQLKVRDFKNILSEAEKSLLQITKSQTFSSGGLTQKIKDLEQLQTAFFDQENELLDKIIDGQNRQEKIKARFGEIYSKALSLAEIPDKIEDFVSLKPKVNSIQSFLEAQNIDHEIKIVR